MTNYEITIHLKIYAFFYTSSMCTGIFIGSPVKFWPFFFFGVPGLILSYFKIRKDSGFSLLIAPSFMVFLLFLIVSFFEVVIDKYILAITFALTILAIPSANKTIKQLKEQK